MPGKVTEMIKLSTIVPVIAGGVGAHPPGQHPIGGEQPEDGAGGPERDVPRRP